MTVKASSQITGNKGLFYVCYELSRRHWNVMPTSRNARGIDIVAYNVSATTFLGIQVKALSKKYPVPLGNSLDKIIGDWWIVVNRLLSNEPCAYILTAEEVRKLAQHRDKQGTVSYWLQPKDYAVAKYKDAWDQIGRGDDDY